MSKIVSYLILSLFILLFQVSSSYSQILPEVLSDLAPKFEDSSQPGDGSGATKDLGANEPSDPKNQSSLVVHLDAEEKAISELLERDVEAERSVISLKLDSLLKELDYQKTLLTEFSSHASSNSSSSFQDIKELLPPFKETASQFKKLKNDSTLLIARYSEEQAILDSKEEFWKKALVEPSLDPLLKKRINAQINLIQKVRDKLKPLIAYFFEVKESVISANLQLKNSIKIINDNNTQYLANLFFRQDNSFWSKDFWNSLDFLERGKIRKTFIHKLEELKNYLNRNNKELCFHLAFFLLWTFFIARIRQTAFVKQAFPKLYDNPLVLIFCSGLLPTYLIYPKPAQAFFACVGFFLLPPLTFLFIDILDRCYKKFILGIAFVVGLEILRSFLRELFDLQIVLLLIQLLVSSALAYHFSKICSGKASREDETYGEEEEEEEDDDQILEPEAEALKKAIKSKRSFLWIFSQLSYFFLLAFSTILVCLLFSFWNLGFFLEESLFGAIYAAILFYAAFQLSKGAFLTFLLAPGVRELNFLNKNTKQIRELSEYAIASLFTFSWFSYVLTRNGWWENLKAKVSWFLGLGLEIGDLFITIKGLALALFIFYLGLKISKLFRFILQEDIYSRRTFDQGLQNTVDTSVHYLVLVIAIFTAISALGVGFQNIAIIAGALSVGIGFGLQNIVNNFVSGLILLVERPVQVGDLILIDDTLGNVTRIGIRSCTVKTFDDADIIFPNATLVTERVINWTHSSHRARISASVGVAYGTPVDECMKTLAEGVKSLPFVLNHPEVLILFNEFADSSLNFTIKVWVLNVNKRDIYRSELLVAVEKALRDKGIEIPFPQRDIHIINDSVKDEPKALINIKN